MCKFASFVLTKDREFWSDNSGWFTLSDLKEWAEGKGKIPMKGR